MINKKRLDVQKTRFDGCVLQGQPAADWVLRRGDDFTLIVELKGKDLPHGARQVENTARWLRRSNLVKGLLKGVVLGTEYPRVRTNLQAAMLRFSRDLGGVLTFGSRDEKTHLEDLAKP